MLLVAFCTNGIFTLALRFRSWFVFALGVFESSHCLQSKQFMRTSNFKTLSETSKLRNEILNWNSETPSWNFKK